MNLSWIVKPFHELTVFELYSILRLRSEVFVMEQNCLFLDMDNKDQLCHHLLGKHNEIVYAYSRLVPVNISYTVPSIGRVVSSPSVRSSGLGKTLMQKSIDETLALFGGNEIKIGAQLYLKKFYSSFDFQQSSEVYLEDGIEHIEMIRKK